MDAPAHVSVLPAETLAALAPRSGGLYVDGTIGLGGHAEAVLRASAPAGRLLGLDRDPQAREAAARRLAPFGDRVRIEAGDFAHLARHLDLEPASVDGILLDLGVSSLQLDSPKRGFSFRHDAPLDMRMDPEQEVDAARLLRDLDQEALADILYHFGEERQARRIAAALAEARERDGPPRGTAELASLVARAVPRRFHPRRIHVATRTFQALRIAVNRELEQLARALEELPLLLAPGGRLCIISFHSLEDRMVKRAFRRLAARGAFRLPQGPARPGEAEKAANPRSRSACLRVLERETQHPPS